MNRFLIALPTALLTCFALSACGPRDDNKTAGQKVDDAMASVKQDAAQAKRAGSEAAGNVAAAATDATITTKINAALAADDKLKATKIDVDTSNGRVVLKGSAPDAGSKDRASTLARAVDGVVDVDNRLAVEGNS